MSYTKHRTDIDGLRALAVVPVVLGHAGLAGFSGGYVGVDVFFVISGYLITGILAREMSAGQFSLLHFYERRARRILPALFAMLALCFIGGYLVMPPPALEALAKSTGATLLFGSNFWFWRTTGDYFGTAAEMAPLLHTWSLAVEEQFYIFFPLVLWVVATRGRQAMIALVAALTLASLALSVWATARMPEANFYLLPTRAWELGLGALVALMAGTGTQGPRTPGIAPGTRGKALRDAAGLMGLALIIGPIVFYDGATPFPGLAALPPCLGAVLILWSGTRAPGPAGRLLSLTPFVWIGLISYSLYLWHWPVQVLLRTLGHSVHLSGADIALSVIAATALAWLSWRFVERPFRRPAPRGFGRGAIFGMSAAGGATLAALGLGVLVTDGLPGRIPAPVLSAYTQAMALPPLRKTCFGRHPEGDRGLCRFGADPEGESPATVLLWGDSHADALAPGISAWMSEQGMTGYFAAKSGCPPLLGVIRADRGAGHDCNGHNSAVMRFVRARPEIDTVILHARWAVAVEGVRPEGEAGGPFLLVLESDPDAPARPQHNHARAVQSLNDTVRGLRDLGREVIVIDSIPEIGWSVPETLFTADYVGTGLPVTPDLEMAQARNARFRDSVAPLVKDAGVRFVSLTADICAPECATKIGDVALYRDDDHLSVQGALMFGPGLMDKAFTLP